MKHFSIATAKSRDWLYSGNKTWIIGIYTGIEICNMLQFALGKSDIKTCYQACRV